MVYFQEITYQNLEKGAYVINLDHSKNTGTHWVVIFVKKDEVIYYDTFGVEYIPKEIIENIEHSSLGNKKTLKQVSLEFKITVQ